MGLLSWIVFGGLAGLAAGFLLRDRGGIVYSVIVGIVGAFLGGFIMNLFGQEGVTGWDWRSFGVAVIGALALLGILRLIRGKSRS
ncbi:MAG: GlsB/YeaQ/YmgE family stress response membrane protein [Actinobacteria bacterium]|nr:GlsB/YeaQ/YmgE family stress response membrane protein [Actinomycetota bacterium]